MRGTAWTSRIEGFHKLSKSEKDIRADAAGPKRTMCIPSRGVVVASIPYIQIAFHQGSSLCLKRQHISMVHGFTPIKLSNPTSLQLSILITHISATIVSISSIVSSSPNIASIRSSRGASYHPLLRLRRTVPTGRLFQRQ